jgi:hypothetical protein
VARAQVFGIGNTRDTASLFNQRDSLAKYALAPAGLNNRLSLCLGERNVLFDRISQMIFPGRKIPHRSVVGQILVNPTFGDTDRLSRFVSNEIREGLEKLGRDLREVDRLAPSAVR